MLKLVIEAIITLINPFSHKVFQSMDSSKKHYMMLLSVK